MIEITQYKTNDDLIFNNKEDALYHEELCEQVNELARTHLNPRPADMWDECPFPQDKVKIMELETKFIKLVLESKNFKWIIDQGHQI